MPIPGTMSRRNALQAALGAIALAPVARLAAATPAQVEGPFFPTQKQPDKDTDMTRVEGRSGRAQGDVIDIQGRVLDETGTPVAGALVDIWQANAKGRYAHEADPNPAPLDPDFQGWAQLLTDEEGRYRVTTIVPGSYQVEAAWTRPPHIHFKVARRGFHELVTQMYFAGNPLNDVDSILLSVPASERSQLMVPFAPAGSAADPVRSGRFDLVLRRV